MPISAIELDLGASIEQLRQQFNNLVSDVTVVQATPTYGNALIFEGTSQDDYETTFTVLDPTADRVIYLPNSDGTILLDTAIIQSTTSTIIANNSTNETVYPVFVDGPTGEQGLESDTSLSYNPSSNILTIGGLTIADAGTIGSASDTNAIAISAAGLVTLSATASLSVTGTSTFNEDVTFTGASYNAVWDKSANSLEFADGANAYFGTGLDLRIFHDGSNSYIQDGGTGSLYIEGSAVSIRNVGGTEAMASFTPDGAVTLYHNSSAKLATSAAGVDVTGSFTISDNGYIGSVSDTDAIRISSAGVVTFSQTPVFSSDLNLVDDLFLDSDGSVIHFGDDGDVTLTHVADTGLRLEDSDKMLFGTGSDLQIYHNGSNSYVVDSGTGKLHLGGDGGVNITNAAVDEDFITCITDGAVSLYYDNAAKLATSATGISVTGTATMSANVVIADAGTIGSASDTDAIAISAAGVVTFSQTPVFSLDVTIEDDLYLDSDGAVIHFGEDADTVLTHVHDTGLRLEDSRKMLFGAGADLEIYHDASDSYIKESGTGDLLIQTVGNNIKLSDTTAGSMIWAEASAVRLYHAGVTRLTTTAAGISVNGNIIIPDDGQIGSTSDTDSITIDASGNVTASQNVTVTGNLTVNGTTTTVSTSNTIIGDSLIELNSGATSNANDLGFVMERGSTGDNAIIAWDESADKFIVGTTTATGASTGNLTIASGTLVASTFEGALTGNATTATTLATARTIGGTSFDGSANIAVALSATATALASARTIGGVSFDGTANIDLPGVNTAGNQNTSGTAATVTTAAQTAITSLGTLTALTVDNVIIDGTTIGHTGDTDLMTLASAVLTVAGRVDASDDIYLTGDEKKVRWYNGSNYVTLGANSSLSSNIALTLPTSVGSSGQAIVTDGSGNLSFAANNVGNATTFTTSANNSADETVYPVFVDGATGEQAAETDTGLTYNPSSGLLTAAAVTTTGAVIVGGALTVTGTTTLNGNLVLGDAAADTLTIGATLQGASPLTFEGATANGHETTFAITDPTADRTITFPDATGTVALTSSDITGNAATATALETARTIGGTSFDGSANIAVALAATATALASARTIGGTSFDGTANIAVALAATATALASARTINGTSFDGTANITVTAAAGTLTGSTLASGVTASSLTSVGTLTTLTVDNIIINGTNIGHTSDTDAISIGADGDVTLTQDLELQHDGATISFGANDDIQLEHIHDTGLRLADNQKMLFGTGNDLQIWHDDSHSHMHDVGTGNFYIKSDGGLIGIQKSTGEEMANFNTDGSVQLYYDNAIKFATDAEGVNITGNLDVSANGDWTGRPSFLKCATSSNDTIATAAASEGAFEIRNDGAGNDAFMAFHASGDFALYFGLDADTNQLAVGGWSMGANKYQIVHTGYADIVTESMMANDAIGSAEMKTLSTLLIKDSGGSTLKTIHGAGA